jgi:hypothetical protein
MKSLRSVFGFCICLFLTLSISATDNSFKLDFDGDGGTDIALYREGSRSADSVQQSYWFFLNPRTGATWVLPWGRTLDVPAPADFDGDGITDLSIYRWWDFETGDMNQWWSRNSSGGHRVMIYEPVFLPSYNKFDRNYVGDGKAEVAFLYQTNTSQNPGENCFISSFYIGDLENNITRKTVGDTCNVNPTPIPGDYNNDGRSEIAVYANHTFKVWFPPYNPVYTAPDMIQTLNVDAPAPGDYDGDGKTDFAGTRIQNGRLLWVVKASGTGIETETDFGFGTDKPVPGDYDADGKTDIAVYRPSDGSWWIMNSSNNVLGLWVYGLPTDTPVAMPVIPFNP